MDPFLSDRHARWHPVDLSLFPLRLSIIIIIERETTEHSPTRAQRATRLSGSASPSRGRSRYIKIKM